MNEDAGNQTLYPRTYFIGKNMNNFKSVLKNVKRLDFLAVVATMHHE